MIVTMVLSIVMNEINSCADEESDGLKGMIITILSPQMMTVMMILIIIPNVTHLIVDILDGETNRSDD